MVSCLESTVTQKTNTLLNPIKSKDELMLVFFFATVNPPFIFATLF
ncbi:hypothetical protein VITU102760_15205 [Vibrio tubiashii]